MFHLTQPFLLCAHFWYFIETILLYSESQIILCYYMMQVYEIKEGNSNRTFLQYSHISCTKSVSERGICSVLSTVPYFLIVSSHRFTDFPQFAPLFFMHVVAACFGRNLHCVWHQIKGSHWLAFMLLWLSTWGRT